MCFECLRLCAFQELTFERSDPGSVEVYAAPVPPDSSSRVWLFLDREMFQDATSFDLDQARSSQLFGRWISRVHRDRLWGPRSERIAFCLTELPCLHIPDTL